MEREQEVRRLKKELQFLADRWARFKHDLRELHVGRVRAVVNGLASRDYAFMCYLDRRRARALARLRELEK